MSLGDLIEARAWNKLYDYVNKLNEDSQPFINLKKSELEELSFCVWQLLDNMGMYSDFDEDFYPQLEKLLAKVCSYLQRTYAGDNDLQCLIGYMISLFPENFPSMGKNYIEVKRIGDLILEEASRREPQNPFVKVLCTDLYQGEVQKLQRNSILFSKNIVKLICLIKKFKVALPLHRDPHEYSPLPSTIHWFLPEQAPYWSYHVCQWPS